MAQSTRRWIFEKVKSLHDSDLLPFHEIHLRRTDTRGGKTRFARYSLACEFWYVSLNTATRTSRLTMSAPESVFTAVVRAATPKL